MAAKWVLLADLSVSWLPDFGSGSGAYVFRDRATEEWKYIGSTSCLRRRLLGNYVGGVGGATTKRLNGLLFEQHHIDDVEVSVYPTADYLRLEESLKVGFAAAHDGQLPDWTRR